MKAIKKQLSLLLLLILSYLAFGFGFALLTPNWQNPDEPAHYNYIRHLRETGQLPVLHPEDYNQAFLEKSVRQGFPPDLGIESLRYEHHQPPLYYLLALPLHHLNRGDLLPLRLFSLLLGSGVLILTYLIGRTALPENHLASCSAVAFVALLPQHTAMMASVNNDVLAEVLMALALLLALRERLHLSTGRPERALLGITVGLCFLTKLTVAICYPVAAFALCRRFYEERRLDCHYPGASPSLIKAWRGDFFLILVLPLLLALPWWIRNLSLYGWPDFLGLIQHASVVAGQPQTGDWIATHGFLLWLWRLLRFTFQSFWGQFGWMALPMQNSVYLLLLLFCGLLSVAWLSNNTDARGSRDHDKARKAGTLLLFSASLTLLAYLWYNCSFVQHQGRYLYSALIPISLAAALGWERLTGRFTHRFPALPFFCLYGLLVGLNLYALFAVVNRHAW